MEANQPLPRWSSVEEEVRALGFDPEQLTPREREELLEMHARCPDAAPSA